MVLPETRQGFKHSQAVYRVYQNCVTWFISGYMHMAVACVQAPAPWSNTYAVALVRLLWRCSGLWDLPGHKFIKDAHNFSQVGRVKAWCTRKSMSLPATCAYSHSKFVLLYLRYMWEQSLKHSLHTCRALQRVFRTVHVTRHSEYAPAGTATAHIADELDPPVGDLSSRPVVAAAVPTCVPCHHRSSVLPAVNRL